MKQSIVMSTLVHAGLAATLFAVRPPNTIMLAGPDAVQVALVDASQMDVAPAPTPSQPAPEPVRSAEDDGVRIEKPKPEPPKPEPARETPPRPAKPVEKRTSPPQTLLPSAAIGAGMSGSLAAEGNFEFAYYLQQVRVRVGSNWTTPAGASSGQRAEVYFRIARDGSVRDVRLAASSGNPWFDQAATRAVTIAAPLPPLPMGYGAGVLGITYGFEYTGP
ncbi:MAG: TonB family protein [Candidatus Eisenbacteria bacterium]